MHEAGAKVDEFVAKHGGTANVSDNEGLMQEPLGEGGYLASDAVAHAVSRAC